MRHGLMAVAAVQKLKKAQRGRATNQSLVPGGEIDFDNRAS
jgi:hypothetical protein